MATIRNSPSEYTITRFFEAQIQMDSSLRRGGDLLPNALSQNEAQRQRELTEAQELRNQRLVLLQNAQARVARIHSQLTSLQERFDVLADNNSDEAHTIQNQITQLRMICSPIEESIARFQRLLGYENN
jgi:hypothetical protein